MHMYIYQHVSKLFMLILPASSQKTTLEAAIELFSLFLF